MKSPLRRPRPSLTLELFGVMTIVLVISLVLVVTSSDRFLRAIGRELVADQERAATEIVEQSVQALEGQGEAHLEMVLKDRATQLDKVFSEIASIVNLLAASAERLQASPEQASDVTLVNSVAFRDRSTRPADFGEEKGKNRKVSLNAVLWHAAPNATSPTIVEDQVTRLKGVGATMKALYAENPLSAWIYLGTADGLFLGYPSDDSLETSYDPRTRDWYRDTKKSGTLTWSLPYLDPGGALLITCSRPFATAPGSRDMAGIAAVDVTIDQLADLMTELEKGLSGHAFLLDGSGKLITRGPKTEAADAHEPFATESLLDEKEPQLAAVAKKMVAGESGLSRFTRADGDQYLAYAHVPSTGWSLGLLVPVETLVAPALAHEKALNELFVAGGARIGGRVDEARRSFAVWGVLGVSILLGLTTSFVFVRFTIPIKGFIRDIEVITKGNLDHRLVSGAENELGDLAQAFNDMTAEVKRAKDQIEEYSRNLERKVDERTAELAASNAELAEAIRKLQEAQTRLVHSEKMASLGQLVAGIAHEINNPVNFIANSVSPLASAIDDFAKLAALYQKDASQEEIRAATEEMGGLQETVDQMRRALELIKTGASRTKTIVLQLRNFSRLDEADMKDADIHEGIDGSLALLNYKIKDRIQVVKDYGTVGRLMCYPGALNQVFMNVLANGIQAIESAKKGADRGRGSAPEGSPTGGGTPAEGGYIGTLTITTRREGENVVVRMRDNGTGIPAHILPKIFDPFFTTKDKERGTGLGLSITHGIVEKHGGRIDVNTEMGTGTEFVITLPATGAHVAAHLR